MIAVFSLRVSAPAHADRRFATIPLLPWLALYRFAHRLREILCHDALLHYLDEHTNRNSTNMGEEHHAIRTRSQPPHVLLPCPTGVDCASLSMEIYSS